MDRSLAVVLDYPDDELVATRTAVAAELPARLSAFGRWWGEAPTTTLRERYVADFDVGGGTSLFLTYHRFGDRRDRGRALVALKRLLREAGWTLDHWELPDYLPLLLELAAVDPEIGLPLLGEYGVEIHAIRRRLKAAGSPWADVLAAVTDELPVPDGDDATRLDTGPPTELVGLEPRR